MPGGRLQERESSVSMFTFDGFAKCSVMNSTLTGDSGDSRNRGECGRGTEGSGFSPSCGQAWRSGEVWRSETGFRRIGPPGDEVGGGELVTAAIASYKDGHKLEGMILSEGATTRGCRWDPVDRRWRVAGDGEAGKEEVGEVERGGRGEERGD